MINDNFKIDLAKIIIKYNLNTDNVAEALFPNNKYKKSALDRILKGKATLDTNQINILANMIGILPQELFMINNWKGEIKNNIIVFKQDEYIVKINYNGAFLNLYKDNVLVYQEINASNKSLTDLITYLNNLIKKLQSNGTI